MRLIAGAFTFALLTVSAGAQTVRFADVVPRLDTYLRSYEERLANVVAEESYRQLTPVPNGGRWVGYRDTFEMDGKPVRDREERLRRLLSSGEAGQAARIAEQNARFNIGDYLVSRNINIPTFALEMMNPRLRDRFKVRRSGTDVLDGRSGWLIEFREQSQLTIVRTPQGGDQRSRIVALVDVQTGEVLRTVLTVDRVKGSITVSYGRAAGIPVLVPIRMAEQYVTRSGDVVGGEATYANFRQFETSVRIVR